LIKAGEGNNSNQLKSLGRPGSGKIRTFLPQDCCNIYAFFSNSGGLINSALMGAAASSAGHLVGKAVGGHGQLVQLSFVKLAG